MDIKTFAIEALKNGIAIVGTTTLIYAGVRLGQKFYGPIEIAHKEQK